LTPIQILLSKVIAMTFVILLGTAVSLFFVLHGVFAVPMKGSLILFFAMTTLYSFTTAGIGLYIATLSRNLAQAALLAILVLMPMIFLSGAWTPPEAMPMGLRQAMYISPLYYFIEMGYAILLKGAGLGILWDSLLGLALLGGLIFGFGVWRFRRQFKRKRNVENIKRVYTVDILFAVIVALLNYYTMKNAKLVKEFELNFVHFLSCS
jgi:ABC-2 type transport system permease protein